MASTMQTANLSPMYLNDTSPALQLTIVDDTGVAINLTGATLSLKMQSTTNSATVKVGAGSWAIDNATQGKCHYTWNVADTNTVGEWYIWVNLSFSGSNQHLDPLTLTILSAP